MQEIWESFVQGLRQTTWLEAVAVIAGIASVYYSRLENILVYPIGLINTIIYIYLSFKGQLFGEATVNLYYTVMSIYGWILWVKRDEQKHHLVQVEFSDRKMWVRQLLFFLFFYITIFLVFMYNRKDRPKRLLVVLYQLKKTNF